MLISSVRGAAIVDLAKKVRHTKMGELIEEAITNPGLVGVKLKQDLLDIAFPATVQSGGVYDLRATAQNDDRPMKYDVITVSIGGLSLQPMCADARGMCYACWDPFPRTQCTKTSISSTQCHHG